MYRQLLLSDESPRSKYWHQLDPILLRRAAFKNVLHTRSYHSADCNTDHSLVCCNIRIQPKRFNRSKTQENPRIAVSKMSQPTLMSQFAGPFERESSVPIPKTLPRHREVGHYPRHHAPHSPGYLREKYLKFSRLV